MSSDELTMGSMDAGQGAEAFVPMSTTQIIDRTLRLYRRHFVHFLAVVAVVYLPMSILNVVAQVAMVSVTTSMSARTNPDVMLAKATATFVFMLAVAAISLLGMVLSTGALTKSVADGYLGRESSVGEVYGAVFQRFGTLLGAFLLVGLLTGMGYLLCVVPGVILSLMWIVTTPVVMVEPVSAWEGMKRSRQLCSGNLGKVFLLLLLCTLLVIVITAPFSVVGGLVQQLLVYHKLPVLGVVASQAISIPSQVVAAPISSAAVVLLYYDLRIRKEAFDLEMLADSMSGPRRGDQ